MEINLDQTEIDDILKRARQLDTDNSTLNQLYKRYREIYFMDNLERPKDRTIDEADWVLTPSPSGRNSVIGIKRLLDTSNLHVKVKERGNTSQNSDKIEAALKKMLDVSSEGRHARVESDAILSAVLYGPIVLSADSLDDLLALEGLPAYKVTHLQKLRKKTPMLIRALNAEEHIAEFEDGMVIMFQWKYKLAGTKVKARYGMTDAAASREYDIRDIWTPDHHLVYANEKIVFAKPHGLGCVPVSISYAGGTELFHKPQEQLNSILYAKAKGGFDKSENIILTTIMTSINRNGLLGNLYWLDPESAQDDIQFTHEGGMRWAKGKVTAVNDKIIDNVVFQVKAMLDDLDGQSTIYKQTLGENIDAGTFSSLAMLSSAGKLPLVDPQRGLEKAFKGIFEHILYRIKTQVIENDLIKPSEIPDDYDLEVTFEPDLPQDNLRNSQIAVSVGDLVSDEWKHENLMQIRDSKEMRKTVAKETIYKAMIGQMLQDPNMMNQLMSFAMGMKPPTPPEATPPGQPTSNGQPTPPMPQGEMIERTDPMIPPQERM